MKMKVAQYQQLLELLDTTCLKPADLPAYIEQVKADPRVKDLRVRISGDIFWRTLTLQRQDFMRACYDDGLNDGHIDTALKKALVQKGYTLPLFE